MTPREAARLMGLPDSYTLPPRTTDAFHLVGDGVAAPVVRFLSENLLLPLVGHRLEGGRSIAGEERVTYDRSAVMRAVKSRDTSPELAVRALLRPIAPGYRLHRGDLPGKPDIVYASRKLAIFVHGCFWHGHDCARGARAPKTNAAYWRAKIARNRARDAEDPRRLCRDGLARARRLRMRTQG